MKERITAVDLQWALNWCQTYEPAPGEEEEAAGVIRRVTAFLEGETQKMVIADIARETGVPVAMVRKAIKVASSPR